jgi:N-acetylglucosamine kinase-like BadF-type ATPase
MDRSHAQEGCRLTMDSYIIGIDGGGTKTRGVLFDDCGAIIKEVIEGPSNIMANEKTAILNIEKTLNQLFSTITASQVKSIHIGLAGASRYPHHEAFIKHLSKQYSVSDIQLTSDIEMALQAIPAHLNQSVILVISGTGSSVMSKDQHKTFMIGGYGHLLGDEGSAYHVVIEAFKFIINEHDEAKLTSSFSRDILKKLKLSDVESIKTLVYGRDKAEIAQLSKVISNLAEEGDSIAIGLLKSEGKQLGIQVIRAYERLKYKDNVIIALKGGFIEQAPYVKESMIKHISKIISTFTVMEKTPDPIFGAFQMSKKSLGGINS